MKFKVGDKVKVRSGLKVGEIYNKQYYVKPMQEYEGKTLTISGIDVDDRWYFIEEDGENWYWTDDMLELNVDSSMTAVEVLEWLGKHYRDVAYKEVFGYDYKFTELLRPEFSSFTAQEIVDKIATYEAAKKVPKSVEVEWINLCRIIQTKDDGTKEVVYEENLKAETPFDEDPDLKEQTEAILKKYALGHDGRYIAVIEEVCRVKENES